MKIALVIGSYNAHGGGAERWTDQHARALLREGHKVHLVARGFQGAPDGAVCHFVDTSRPGTASPRLLFAERAEQLLRAESFDVVHDMGDGWHADLFMPHHGTRLGGYAQNTKLLPAPLRPLRLFAYHWLPRYREFSELERRQYEPRPGKLFVALSHMVEEHMRKYHRTSAKQVRVVYNGVDIDHFHPPDGKARRLSARKNFGIEQRIVFLIVAHNFKLKGLDPLLTSFAELVRAGHSVALVVAGAGQIRAYQRTAEKLGCARSVYFVGNQPDPIACYHAADVYVQPTYYDPCSLVVLEALACGLPVITTRHNGASELLQPGREGFVLQEPDDTRSMTEYLSHYLDGDRRRLAGEAARRLAEQHSFARNLADLMSLYWETARSRLAA